MPDQPIIRPRDTGDHRGHPLATEAAQVKAAVADVLDELQVQRVAADDDRAERTRRYRRAIIGAVVAVLLLGGGILVTEVTARDRFSDFREQQRSSLCPLVLPLAQRPDTGLTPEGLAYRDAARRAATELGCPAP